MTGFADTLRGNGLAEAQRALAGLQGDPLRLNRERRRFSQSPPPCTSDRSGTKTRSVSPNAPTEQQWRRQERRMQLGEERLASEPYYQFEHQVHDEKKRIMEANLNQRRRLRIGDDPDKIAHGHIKKCWVEQGIWNTTWNQFASGRWKHEEPLEYIPELETDSEAESTPPLFPSLKKQPQAKSRLPKSDEEKRYIAQRRVIREREREASRPYYQFVYQVSKERERIQEESANMEGLDAATINTTAYDNVKNTWTKRCIWNGRWGILPGMSWKHEEPLEEPPEELLEEEAVSAPVPQSLFGNGSHEAGDAPILNFYESPLGNNFGFPVTNLCESSTFTRNPFLVQSNHHQASGTMHTSQHRTSADVDSAGLENGRTERSPSAPNLPRLRTGRKALFRTTGQALRPSQRSQSQEDRQPASASIGKVHLSKISQVASKRRLEPKRQLKFSEQVSFGDPPLLPSVDAIEPQHSPPLVSATLRRSKRAQPPDPIMAKHPAKKASAVPSKCGAPTNPRRKGTGSLATTSSAKSQGVSKRQPTKPKMGKAKRK